MKKIVMILILGCAVFSSADAKVNIYYTNGIDTSDLEAQNSRDLLIEKLKKAGILNDPAIETIKDDHGEEHNVTLIYNFTRGTMDDLLETFFQIRESGQLDDVGFFLFVGALLSGNPILPVAVLTAAVAPMQDIQKIEQDTVDKMIEAYTKYSVDKGNQIMLVSHSQGNLFANRVFDELNATGYDYKNFANVQVAPPADRVHAPIGKHITVCGDMVINPIPHSMRL